tara:strand:- start:748 stop:936 length:189 start_codon:yes stop_codon:yes gene_type:complete
MFTQAPLAGPEAANVKVEVNPESKRLQLLTPFNAWDGKDYTDMPILIKVAPVFKSLRASFHF